MTPWEKYQDCLRKEDFNPDLAQKKAVEYTQKLYDELLSVNKNNGLINRIKKQINGEAKVLIKGLYFWGGVGRGKTYIIDAFYDSLPFPEKQRIHFNRFMQMIHHELKLLKYMEDPLIMVADKIASKTRVLCLDEFHVSDITDAMLLAGLIKSLFDREVVLVTTSNENPDQLYSDGLQRERFLPAIDLIKQHTQVFNIDSGIDYRLRFLDKAEIYHCPLDDSSFEMMSNNFEHIAPDEGSNDIVLDIEGRQIKTIRCADGVVWFDFKEICDGPRGPADYIEISRLYQTVLISNIPKMSDRHNDQAKRFMTLVDEFYDHNVKLIITAEDMPDMLYSGRRLGKAFQRTTSRLQEMQTHGYLARQHLP